MPLTEVLSQDGNLEGLSRINRELLAKAGVMDFPQRVVLDMDSTEIPVYGGQEHSAYNGHFESTCYHPSEAHQMRIFSHCGGRRNESILDAAFGVKKEIPAHTNSEAPPSNPQIARIE